MPSDKKRINLTVPDEVYERIQLYRQKYGIANDAGACLQLIVQQLNALDNSKKLFDFIAAVPTADLQNISSEGMANLKLLLEQEKQ